MRANWGYWGHWGHWGHWGYWGYWGHWSPVLFDGVLSCPSCPSCFRLASRGFVPCGLLCVSAKKKNALRGNATAFLSGKERKIQRDGPEVSGMAPCGEGRFWAVGAAGRFSKRMPMGVRAR